jgi:hypothetical protein
MQFKISDNSSTFLNVICFDVPFPADYGGAIEEFYKLKELHNLDVKIYLHCFVYGERKQQPELEKYCEKVFYYERKRTIKDVFSDIPFIVKTRMHKELLQNLLNNDFPILFDGTHTTGFINHPEFKNRKKIVRLHNIEWIYYNILFHSAIKPFEKLFYFSEYKKLKKYDKLLSNASILSCLSQSDTAYYQDKFPEMKISFEPVFHENESLKCKSGNGNYILYHGNLSLLDNYQIIIDLLSDELKDCKHDIIIAGKNPDSILTDFLKDKSNIRLIANPSNEILDDLIENAHICLAFAKNPSGVKLKLINSLFKSRFVICNINAVNGSDLESICIISENENNLLSTVNQLMLKSFNEADIQSRKLLLNEKYSNVKNAAQIAELIFNEL